MSDQPPSHQAPRVPSGRGPWPRAVPPYSPPPQSTAPGGDPVARPAPGGHPAQPGESRLLLSRWTKRVAWLGVAATGIFSFVAARSVPGRSATPRSENPTGSQVSAPTGDPSSTDGSVLQPASELPQASTRRPSVRSGAS